MRRGASTGAKAAPAAGRFHGNPAAPRPDHTDHTERKAWTSD